MNVFRLFVTEAHRAQGFLQNHLDILALSSALALVTTQSDYLDLCLSLSMPLAFTQVRSLAFVVI